MRPILTLFLLLFVACAAPPKPPDFVGLWKNDEVTLDYTPGGLAVVSDGKGTVEVGTWERIPDQPSRLRMKQGAQPPTEVTLAREGDELSITTSDNVTNKVKAVPAAPPSDQGVVGSWKTSQGETAEFTPHGTVTIVLPDGTPLTGTYATVAGELRQKLSAAGQVDELNLAYKLDGDELTVDKTTYQRVK